MIGYDYAFYHLLVIEGAMQVVVYYMVDVNHAVANDCAVPIDRGW